MARDDLADVAVTCNAVILPVDCREGMRLCLAPQSVHTVVTSPPYFGLRDYDHADQIGLEQTPEEYVASIVDVFREIRRVLRDDGTVWLNIGDSYAGSGKGVWNIPDEEKKARGVKESWRPSTNPTAQKTPGSLTGGAGLSSKQLIGIPWRLAFALQADGWYLRQEIIWSKPNPMPESVRDRCTKSHEQIFLLSKSPRYYFDADAISEPVADSSKARVAQNGGNPIWNGDRDRQSTQNPQTIDINRMVRADGLRNKRSVWTVTTKPYRSAHFATFPPDLIEPCILAGSPPGGMVLDPFGGAGTTALVAQRLGRSSVSFELNAKYVAMAEARLAAG